MVIFVSYSASWIRISAARHDGLRDGLGKGGSLASEHVVKIGSSVIGFAEDTFDNGTRGVGVGGLSEVL